MNRYLAVLKKYAVFSGRACRREYWAFALGNVLIAFALSLIEGLAGIAAETGTSVLASLFSLAVLVPSLAVSVRRLHDTNRSGWWLLVALVPLIGGFVLLIFMVEDGTPGENQHGPNPKIAVA